MHRRACKHVQASHVSQSVRKRQVNTKGRQRKTVCVCVCVCVCVLPQLPLSVPRAVTASTRPRWLRSSPSPSHTRPHGGPQDIGNKNVRPGTSPNHTHQRSNAYRLYLCYVPRRQNRTTEINSRLDFSAGPARRWARRARAARPPATSRSGR